MGRPPKPRALKLLDGDQPCRVNDQEPVPGDLAPIEPTMTLGPVAREVWGRLAPELIKKGVFTSWDADAFTRFCSMVGLYHQAREALEVDGLTARGAAGGVIKSPYFQIMKDCEAIMTTLGSRFGLTPSDRTKIVVGKVEESGKRGPERFLTG